MTRLPQCPVLPKYACYRWDAVREQHQVVYPESVLVLNETGSAIVREMDGRSLDAIVEKLAEVFDAVDKADQVRADVNRFLERLEGKGLLRDAADDSSPDEPVG